MAACLGRSATCCTISKTMNPTFSAFTGTLKLERLALPTTGGRAVINTDNDQFALLSPTITLEEHVQNPEVER